MENDNGLSVQWSANGKSGRGTLTVVLADNPIYVDDLNIKSDKARSGFISALRARCSSLTDEQAEFLGAELMKVAADAANKLETPQADTSSRPDPAALLAAMPENVREEARAMLESPDLMQRVVTDIGMLGVAGEKVLAATAYLTGTSRLLSQPLAVIVQGPSSSGKSYVIKKAACLFPSEAVLIATALTPQALYYMPPQSLVHRLVVVGERSRLENDDTAEATRALREMLSEGRISKWAPIKVNNQYQTVSIEQDGPIAYVESTTSTKIFNEDANRCILLNTDEQPEQTRRILTRLASIYSGCESCDVERIKQRHYAAQRMLQPYAVIVPYADRLAAEIDNHRVEARRSYPQLISMIQASALLHQKQRKVDQDGRLLADADDYILARHLLAAPMSRQLGGGISEAATRFLKRLQEWFGTSVFTKPDQYCPVITRIVSTGYSKGRRDLGQESSKVPEIAGFSRKERHSRYGEFRRGSDRASAPCGGWPPGRRRSRRSTPVSSPH